jgi:hypothetical protein
MTQSGFESGILAALLAGSNPRPRPRGLKVTSYDERWLKAGVAGDMRARAMRGLYDGTEATAGLLDYCRGWHPSTGTLLLFTRDVGHHTGGWWKNPDYERCWHLSLSLSFFDPETRERAPQDKKLAAEWLTAFYGDDRRKLWCEPPYSEQGKAADVWHYRLFCDQYWRPIVPRGEVYSRELTEAGWKSYSDLRWEEEVEEAR